MAALSVLSTSGGSTGTKFSRLILSGVASIMCSASVIMFTCKGGEESKLLLRGGRSLVLACPALDRPPHFPQTCGSWSLLLVSALERHSLNKAHLLFCFFWQSTAEFHTLQTSFSLRKVQGAQEIWRKVYVIGPLLYTTDSCHYYLVSKGKAILPLFRRDVQ